MYCSVVLTFKSVDEIPWCDHSNETSSIFYKMKFGIYLEFWSLGLLGVIWLSVTNVRWWERKEMARTLIWINVTVF